MARIVLNSRADGETDNGPWRHSALPVHPRLAARLVLRVVVWPGGPTLRELLTIGERVRVEHPLPGLSRLDLG